jgi:hypothetical protein
MLGRRGNVATSSNRDGTFHHISSGVLSLYAEILASSTFALVAYQDFRDRMVSDWAWAPAAVGAVVVFLERPELIDLSAAKLGLFALLGLLSVLLGAFGQADGLALAFMSVGTSYLSPLPQLFAASAMALGHILFLYARSGFRKVERTMTVEEALRQNVWIPQEVTSDGKVSKLDHSPEKAWKQLEGYVGKGAVVRATYGVPLSGYLALGYLVGFVYLMLNPS